MDSDRVLVLDAGKVIEFDEPFELLKNEDGLFSLMVKMTGKGMASNLKEMARVAHELKHKDNSEYSRAQLRELKNSFINSSKRMDDTIEEDINNDIVVKM